MEKVQKSPEQLLLDSATVKSNRRKWTIAALVILILMLITCNGLDKRDFNKKASTLEGNNVTLIKLNKKIINDYGGKLNNKDLLIEKLFADLDHARDWESGILRTETDSKYIFTAIKIKKGKGRKKYIVEKCNHENLGTKTPTREIAPVKKIKPAIVPIKTFNVKLRENGNIFYNGQVSFYRDSEGKLALREHNVSYKSKDVILDTAKIGSLLYKFEVKQEMYKAPKFLAPIRIISVCTMAGSGLLYKLNQYNGVRIYKDGEDFTEHNARVTKDSKRYKDIRIGAFIVGSTAFATFLINELLERGRKKKFDKREKALIEAQLDPIDFQ